MKLALLSGCLAALVLASAGCDLILDIDRLDRGEDAGLDAGVDAGKDAATPIVVETVAIGQCNPGRITTADGFVYWTTIKGDGAPCTAKESNAIRRLAVDSKGMPEDVVTSNLDGENSTGRPWDLRVEDGNVYWIGAEKYGYLCTAKATLGDHTCTLLASGKTCGGMGLGSTSQALYFRGGTNCGTSEIQRYDLGSSMITTTGLSVSGGYVTAIAATPTWLAWVDLAGSACMTTNGSNRLNVAGPNKASWASCSPSSSATHVTDIALDDSHLYWLVDEGNMVSSLHALTLSDQLQLTAQPTTLVTGLKEAKTLALDEHYVYITSEDRGGAVLYVPKDALMSRSAADASVLAEGLTQGTTRPYAITAAPGLSWVYWLQIGPMGSVMRASKPAP